VCTTSTETPSFAERDEHGSYLGFRRMAVSATGRCSHRHVSWHRPTTLSSPSTGDHVITAPLITQRQASHRALAPYPYNPASNRHFILPSKGHLRPCMILPDVSLLRNDVHVHSSATAKRQPHCKASSTQLRQLGMTALVRPLWSCSGTRLRRSALRWYGHSIPPPSNLAAFLGQWRSSTGQTVAAST
jgi:hypothetical protein